MHPLDIVNLITALPFILKLWFLFSDGHHNRQDSMDVNCSESPMSINCRCNKIKTLERRKQHMKCLAHSLVGTPNYIAPEVLLRQGKGFNFWNILINKVWFVGNIIWNNLIVLSTLPLLQSDLYSIKTTQTMTIML